MSKPKHRYVVNVTRRAAETTAVCVEATSVMEADQIGIVQVRADPDKFLWQQSQDFKSAKPEDFIVSFSEQWAGDDEEDRSVIGPMYTDAAIASTFSGDLVSRVRYVVDTLMDCPVAFNSEFVEELLAIHRMLSHPHEVMAELRKEERQAAKAAKRVAKH